MIASMLAPDLREAFVFVDLRLKNVGSERKNHSAQAEGGQFH
jgi:hypothetical protein